MRKLVIAASTIATVAVLTLSPVAMAQNTGSQTGLPNLSGTTREAPIGHRQPRADQVPSEKNLSDPNNPVNKEDAALDRKIKSICRGC
jgi:hypothetical protein